LPITTRYPTITDSHLLADANDYFQMFMVCYQERRLLHLFHIMYQRRSPKSDAVMASLHRNRLMCSTFSEPRGSALRFDMRTNLRYVLTCDTWSAPARAHEVDNKKLGALQNKKDAAPIICAKKLMH
ncbi:hypothetical protein M8C21_023719, partial [Ambrosia artemisiifolia]